MYEKDTKILYITCCESGFYCLQKMYKKNYKFASVITVAPEVAQKYEVSGYQDILEWCNERNLPVISLKNYQLKIEDLSNIEYDIILVNGWNRLISKEIIESAKFGGIGIHAGHPPIGHGRSPLVWNIIYGMKEIEAYCFKLTPKADDGDILHLRRVEITSQDSARTLYEKVMFHSVELFEKSLSRQIRGKEGLRQPLDHSKVYPKRTPEDGLIDFSQSMHQIYDFIRAQSSPYPGAFGFIDNLTMKIWGAIPFDCFSFSEKARMPGEVLESLPSGLVVQTGTTPIWITEYELFNRNGSEINFQNFHQDSLVGKIISNAVID